MAARQRQQLAQLVLALTALHGVVIVGRAAHPAGGHHEAASWTLSPPTAPATVLRRGGADGYACLRIPSIVTNGTAVVVFAQARKGAGCAYSPSDVVSSRSDTGGRSWGPMRVAVPHTIFGDAGDGIWSPSPVYDRRSGELLLVFLRLLANYSSEAAVAKSPYAMETWLVRSRDFGLSWSKPENISYVHANKSWVCWTTGPGAGLQLSSGRLVIQGYHGTLSGGCGDPGGLRGHVLLSDNGKTWRLGGSIAGGGMDESQAVALAAPGKTCSGDVCEGSDRLLLNARNDGGCTSSEPHCRVTATSETGGETWGGLVPAPQLETPSSDFCEGSIVRHDSLVFFSNPKPSSGGRVRANVTLRVSSDDTLTFPLQRQLIQGASGYSALAPVVDADGVLTVVAAIEVPPPGDEVNTQANIVVVRVRVTRSAGPPQPPASKQSKVLFLDESVLSEKVNVSLRMGRPNKHSVVIASDQPWENLGIGQMTVHTLQVSAHEVRVYYGCMEANTSAFRPGIPDGDRGEVRRVCVAVSHDSGLSFTKPTLGLYARQGHGTSNNIIGISGEVKECVLGNVFIDANPNASPRERFKLACALEPEDNTWFYSSSDGFDFTRMFDSPSINGSDTKNTCLWDDRYAKYVCYVRLDKPGGDVGPGFFRRIGRCEAATLDGFVCGCGYGHDCEEVFADTSKTGIDLYTNAFTKYEDSYLFFPTMFFHANLYGGHLSGGDGIEDARLLVSRDGKRADYPPAANGRMSFVPLGVNKCDFAGPLGMAGIVPDANARNLVGWCNQHDGSEGRTSFDTSKIWVSSGYALSSDGTAVRLYYGGNPWTEGGIFCGPGASAEECSYSWGQPGTGRPNAAIGLLTLRRDVK